MVVPQLRAIHPPLAWSNARRTLICGEIDEQIRVSRNPNLSPRLYLPRLNLLLDSVDACIYGTDHRYKISSARKTWTYGGSSMQPHRRPSEIVPSLSRRGEELLSGWMLLLCWMIQTTFLPFFPLYLFFFIYILKLSISLSSFSVFSLTYTIGVYPRIVRLPREKRGG